MEGFRRQKGMAGELLEKEEKGLFLGQSSSFGGGGGEAMAGVLSCR